MQLWKYSVLLFWQRLQSLQLTTNVKRLCIELA